MYYRELITKMIPKRKRILEIGPLCNPIIKKSEFSKVYYGDIRSTEEIKKLYTCNDYLKQTGIKVNTDDIVEIDYVLKNGYKEAFSGKKKFDYIVISNVIEHIPDFLGFFEDVQNALKPSGKLVIIYPDKRYCFDHYRESVSFSDIIATHIDGVSANARKVMDFVYNVVLENDPGKYWRNEFIPELESKDYKKALEAYEKTKKGEIVDDVHYWPVTDYTLLKIFYDLQKAKLFKFSLDYFGKTLINTQEFLVILKFENKIISHDEKMEKEMINIRPRPNYFNIDEISAPFNEKIKILMQENNELRSMYEYVVNQLELRNREINSKNDQIIKMTAEIESLKNK